jgi:hypothetical protein
LRKRKQSSSIPFLGFALGADHKSKIINQKIAELSSVLPALVWNSSIVRVPGRLAGWAQAGGLRDRLLRQK